MSAGSSSRHSTRTLASFTSFEYHEYSAKALQGLGSAMFAKGEKLEKDGKLKESFDVYKEWVALDPEKDAGKFEKTKIVFKAENAINGILKKQDSSDSSDSVKMLAEVITQYDKSTYKTAFWAAYMAARQQNFPTMRDQMDAARKVMPKIPAVPYSTIWQMMELIYNSMSQPEPEKAQAEPVSKKKKGKKK